MKKKLSPLLIGVLALWSVLCIGIYFFAVARGFEPILPIYLSLAFLGAFAYLFLQSPAVEIKEKEEDDRKRKGLLRIGEGTHRKLSQGLLVFCLPLFLAFLADYLLIVMDAHGLIQGLL